MKNQKAVRLFALLTVWVLLFSADCRGDDDTTAVHRQAPSIAIVVDDAAYLGEAFYEAVNSGLTLTIAVLPHHRATMKIAALAREKGMEVILHQPMANVGGTLTNTPGLIFPGFDTSEVETELNAAINSLGMEPEGMNNHMGSDITHRPEIMRPVMHFLTRRGMYYLDSVTTGRTVAGAEAQRASVVYLQRDIFLDNVLTRENMEAQFESLVARAWKEGDAIGILHCKKLSVVTVLELMRERTDVRFVSLRELAEARRRKTVQGVVTGTSIP